MTAWDARTGAVLWDACPLYASGFFASPALSAGGDSVFAVTRPGAFYAYRTLDGTLAWQRNLATGDDPTVVDGSIAVSPTTGSLFVGTVIGAVFALNASDGSDVWPEPFETGSNVSSTPALWGGSVFFAASNGLMYCVDEARGVLLWSAEFTTPGIGDFQRSALMSSPTISLDGEHLFIGTADGTVVSMRTDTGAIAWRCNVTASLGSPSAPSIDCTPSLSPDGALVFIGTSFLDSNIESAFGSVLALAAATGDVVWVAPIATDVVSSPTVGADGVVYVGTAYGPYGVSALEGKTGRVLWSISHPDYFTTAAPVLGPDGQLFVCSFASDLPFLALVEPPPQPSALPSPSPPPLFPPQSSALTLWLSVVGGILLGAALLGGTVAVLVLRARVHRVDGAAKYSTLSEGADAGTVALCE